MLVYRSSVCHHTISLQSGGVGSILCRRFSWLTTIGVEDVQETAPCKHKYIVHFQIREKNDWWGMIWRKIGHTCMLCSRQAWMMKNASSLRCVKPTWTHHSSSDLGWIDGWMVRWPLVIQPTTVKTQDYLHRNLFGLRFSTIPGTFE